MAPKPKIGKHSTLTTVNPWNNNNNFILFLPQRKYTCQYRHSEAGRRRKDTSVIPSATTQIHVFKDPKPTRSLALR